MDKRVQQIKGQTPRHDQSDKGFKHGTLLKFGAKNGIYRHQSNHHTAKNRIKKFAHEQPPEDLSLKWA